MEACGAAHHWARVMIGLGFEVKLIASEAVKPFVKRGKKNDPADAAAICAAASRPEAKFVAVKSLEQQGVLALHSTRSLLVKQETMLANAMRGLATEFGLVVPKGMDKLEELAKLVEEDKTFPEQARRAFAELREHRRGTADRIEGLGRQIVAHARRDDTARRLATIPGIGPITASLLAATVGDHIGRITKAGNKQIRTLLVLGATSMLHRAEQWDSVAGAWLRGLLERHPVRPVTVALANKMARIAWAVMTRNEVYHAKGGVAPVTAATA